ncbi:PE domain-containing protein [Mycobacterium spongiae]|uniref:PE domain-containing protein n=1 Tax=Mycobacterium spongiae TaxID=886343 RepID=A0A975PYC7_9MYCO|nr:PE family protein [Mycobacterium spongiae]QUR68729.1 PE domain-containing protein [Mycobacterium spongiae]
MSYVAVVPKLLASAADLEGIGSALSSANVTAVAPTTEMLAAGADEVSAAVAAVFSGHALNHQMLSTQMATATPRVATSSLITPPLAFGCRLDQAAAGG